MSESPSAPAAPVPAPARSLGLLGSARNRFIAIIVLIVLAILFAVGGDSWLSVINIALSAALATLSLNVLSGYTGQISLGIAFFMAIGAYTAALLGGPQPTGPLDPQGFALPFFVWLPAAGIVAALVGALVGPTT